MKSGKARRSSRKTSRTPVLRKTPTGIEGLDALTSGGLPAGRPTLLCGGAGSGKTLLAMEFLARGAEEFGEPGLFVAFEERTEELETNFASLGHDLKALVARKKLALEFINVERSELEEAGEYDLEGLFIRLGHAIDGIGARRVALDGIEVLFSGLASTAILRAELGRLFRWLKTKGVTAVVTAERGERSLTRHGLEEYVADCVILLDHRVSGQVATRLLRVVKYRGSGHGTSEYPFLIAEGGLSILPVSLLGLNYEVSSERISSGVPRLDAMMGNRGYFRGSSVLVSGTAGTGKTSLAAHFVHASAARRERCLWFAFEESTSQIIRNMRSIGIDLAPAVRSGMLQLHADRPTRFNLEMHLASMHRRVNEFKPRTVVIDPISNFMAVGSEVEIKSMLTRLIDYFKMQQITSLFTCLNMGRTFEATTEVGVSSLMDTWILLRDVECGAERNRLLHLLKSRGMAHSNQVREFLITDHGLDLQDVYLGPSGAVLTGSARSVRKSQEAAQAVVRRQEEEGQERELEYKRQAMEAQIAALRARFEIEDLKARKTIEQQGAAAKVLAVDRGRMAKQRQADALKTGGTITRRSGGSR